MVGIIMGSLSDRKVMQEAADILTELGLSWEMDIVSAHRTPEKMVDYAKTARNRGLRVIIAGAGGAAHLPGMVASMTSFPLLVFRSNQVIRLMAGTQYYLFCKCLLACR